MFTYAQTNQAKGETRQVRKQRARCESTLWFPLKSKLLFVSLGGADSPVRDSGPRGGVRHSEGLHDCWPTQWTHWAAGKDRPGQLGL